MCACASWLCAKKSQRTVFSFICRSFFLLNLFDVRWPNEIWWYIFQENVVEEDECQQLCGDQVTIFIAPDPSPIIIALPCPSACPSLILFWIHWWLLSASDVTKAMLASFSNSLVAEFSRHFEAEVWSIFWIWIMVKTFRLRFGDDFEAEVWSGFWSWSFCRNFNAERNFITIR